MTHAITLETASDTSSLDFRDPSLWTCNQQPHAEVFDAINETPESELLVDNPLVRKAAIVCGGCALKGFCVGQDLKWVDGEKTDVPISAPTVSGGLLVLRRNGKRTIESVPLDETEEVLNDEQCPIESEGFRLSDSEPAQSNISYDLDTVVKKEIKDSYDKQLLAAAIKWMSLHQGSMFSIHDIVARVGVLIDDEPDPMQTAELLYELKAVLEKGELKSPLVAERVLIEGEPVVAFGLAEEVSVNIYSDASLTEKFADVSDDSLKTIVIAENVQRVAADEELDLAVNIAYRYIFENGSLEDTEAVMMMHYADSVGEFLDQNTKDDGFTDNFGDSFILTRQSMLREMLFIPKKQPEKTPDQDYVPLKWGSREGNSLSSPVTVRRAKTTFFKFGACKGIKPGLMFPTNDDVAEEMAKEVCRGCIVQSPCLEYALETRQKDGVWGGATERERRRILRRGRRVPK